MTKKTLFAFALLCIIFLGFTAAHAQKPVSKIVAAERAVAAVWKTARQLLGLRSDVPLGAPVFLY